MLDDKNVFKQRDPQGAVGVVADQWQQLTYDATVQQGAHDGRVITNVVVAGMGGSALAGMFVRTWLRDVLSVPFEVVREASLPSYAGETTLVIVSSCSGNTEEALRCFDQAITRGAQVAVVTSGGTLLERAKEHEVAFVAVPDRSVIEPRMTTFAQVRALTGLLGHFSVIDAKYYHELAEAQEWLKAEMAAWTSTVTTDKNYAKQLALLSVGKTAVFYGGSYSDAVAYKWKVSWNENAKNLAFWSQYPEVSHNEYIGWTSHPIEKPFVVVDIMSTFESSIVKRQAEVADRLAGSTLLRQLLWGSVLGDFVSIYVAVVNGVNPTSVALIEKLKREVAQD
jgi:glucose/mannose-6-phosphate isomerase